MEQEKKVLREQMLAQRAALNSTQKESYDQEICLQLENLIRSNQYKVVHTFLPMGDEINLYPLIQKLLDWGITVLCPQTLRKRKLAHLQLRALDDLEEGLWGTRHPAGAEPFVGEIDLVIVPGLAFDTAHNRLGYGAGYYDSFLKEYPKAKTLAVAYPFQIVSKVPTEAHDYVLDGVVFHQF